MRRRLLHALRGPINRLNEQPPRGSVRMVSRRSGVQTVTQALDGLL